MQITPGSPDDAREETVPLVPPLGARVASGFWWFVAAQTVRRGSGLIIAAVLARLLVPNDFGIAAIATAVIALLTILSDFGLGSALIRQPRLSASQATAAFWICAAAGVAIVIIGWSSAPFVAGFYSSPQLENVIRLMVFTVPFTLTGQVVDSLLQRELNFSKLARIDTSAALIGGVLAVVAAAAGAGVWALVIQFCVQSIGACLWKFAATGWRPSIAVDFSGMRGLVTFAASVLIGTLLNFASGNSDNFLIGRVLGTQALGLYALAYNLTILPAQTVGASISRVVFPALAAIQFEPARFRSAYVRALRVGALVNVPLSFGLAAGAPVFVRAVYGPKWADVAPLVSALLIVGLLQGLNTTALAFYALGRAGTQLALAFFFTAVLVIAFFIGVEGGLEGLVRAYACAAPVAFLPAHLIANRLVGIRLKNWASAVAPALGAGGAMWFAVKECRQSLPATLSLPLRAAVLLFVGGVVYLSLIVCIAVLRTRDAGAVVSWLMHGGDHSTNVP